MSVWATQPLLVCVRTPPTETSWSPSEFAQTACLVYMNTQDASVYKARLQQAEREKDALRKQLAEADAGLAHEVAEKLKLQEQGPRAQVSLVWGRGRGGN